MEKKIPSWIKVKDFDRKKYSETLDLINKNKINTVCVEANCPNRYECFSKKTATFMILGNICTRNCAYCNVKNGIPEEPYEKEPERIANAVKKLNLKYAVITCVTRDDLDDCGSSQFVKVVDEIKKVNSSCKMELLISDLNGNFDALKKIVNLNPEVINHNIEVVKELFKDMRPNAKYERSIKLLQQIKKINPMIKTKSGLMLGLGETKEQIIKTMNDLRKAGCDILTLGQYLQPSEKHAKVKKFYTPEEFNELAKIGESIGFLHVESGPMVRSSYHAGGYSG
jgi:lipoic acid synthetase